MVVVVVVVVAAAARPSLPILWNLGQFPALPRAEFLLLLPWSRGGALDPFSLPHKIITHQHFIYFWLTGVSGVGDLEGVTQSPGPLTVLLWTGA